jgi:hypothetical protein
VKYDINTGKSIINLPCSIALKLMTQVMQCLVYQFTTETCSEEIIIMHLIMHYYSRVFQLFVSREISHLLYVENLAD